MKRTIKIFAIIVMTLVALWLSYCIANVIFMFDWFNYRPSVDKGWWLREMVWFSSFGDLVSLFTGELTFIVHPSQLQSPWLIVYEVGLAGLLPFILSVVAARLILKAQGRAFKFWYSSAVIAFFVLLWNISIVLDRRSEIAEMGDELNRVVPLAVQMCNWAGYYEYEFDKEHRPLDYERYRQLRSESHIEYPRDVSDISIGPFLGGGRIYINPPAYMKFHDPERYAKDLLKEIQLFSRKEITSCSIICWQASHDPKSFLLDWNKTEGITTSWY